MVNDFLDEGYEVPQSNSGYMKFQLGDNKFRVLSRPVVGWMYWNLNDKPVRHMGAIKPNVEASLIKPEKDGKRDLKHFWVMIVWNYEKKAIEILEITQVSIQKVISNYAKDENWGSPYSYDLKVTKTEKAGKTEYAIMALPHKKIDSEVVAAFNERRIDIHALLEGKNPFQDIVNVTPMEMVL